MSFLSNTIRSFASASGAPSAHSSRPNIRNGSILFNEVFKNPRVIEMGRPITRSMQLIGVCKSVRNSLETSPQLQEVKYLADMGLQNLKEDEREKVF